MGVCGKTPACGAVHRGIERMAQVELDGHDRLTMGGAGVHLEHQVTGEGALGQGADLLRRKGHDHRAIVDPLRREGHHPAAGVRGVQGDLESRALEETIAANLDAAPGEDEIGEHRLDADREGLRDRGTTAVALGAGDDAAAEQRQRDDPHRKTRQGRHAMPPATGRQS
jgi:hypothetical protein